MTLEEQRWQAVQARDTSADGVFVYGVLSTGVYCHPSCPSRAARRDNVRFFATSEAAQTAGFRACRRCQPDQGTPFTRRLQRVEQACQWMDGAEALSVKTIAARLAVSEAILTQDFRACLELTPGQWRRARRREGLLANTLAAASVDDAIAAAGYTSASRFYADSRDRLAMCPSALRHGASGELIRYVLVDSRLGDVLVAWTDRGLCAVELSLDDQDSADAIEARVRQRYHRATLKRDTAAGVDIVDAVVARIDEPAASQGLPLELRGTAFQQRVWTALTRIPVGYTVNYSELAEELGHTSARRAVANACAANPLAVVVPCHRVVRADGSVSGYRWGNRRKALLLRDEAKLANASV